MTNELLNFEEFLRNSNIGQLADNIMKTNSQLMSLGQSDETDRIILIFHNIVQTLRILDSAIVKDGLMDKLFLLETIKQLIAIHQSLISYKKDHNLSKEVNDVIESLVILYPLFLIGEIMTKELK